MLVCSSATKHSVPRVGGLDSDNDVDKAEELIGIETDLPEEV